MAFFDVFLFFLKSLWPFFLDLYDFALVTWPFLPAAFLRAANESLDVTNISKAKSNTRNLFKKTSSVFKYFDLFPSKENESNINKILFSVRRRVDLLFMFDFQ